MKAHNLVLAVLALAIGSCDDSGTGGAGTRDSQPANIACVLDLVAAPDGTTVLEGACPRDAAGMLAAIERAPGVIQSAKTIALGRTAFGPLGVFDRCAVMARLAADPRWTSSIDSNTASAPLRDALNEEGLAPPISSGLAKAKRKLHDVSLEKVITSDGPVTDCPKSPEKVPVEAQIWLSLE